MAGYVEAAGAQLEREMNRSASRPDGDDPGFLRRMNLRRHARQVLENLYGLTADEALSVLYIAGGMVAKESHLRRDPTAPGAATKKETE